MYIPEKFREDDPQVLKDFMDRYNFATLITQADGAMVASHIPFVLDRSEGTYGTLQGHIARSNPQLGQLESGREALVIFQGPHSYISPRWYANQRTVPTWNYAVAHAYGTPRMLAQGELEELLQKLVARHEGAGQHEGGAGWSFTAEQPWIHPMLGEICGFEIPIVKLEGKFKLNQNRSAADRKGVIAALEASEDSMQRDVAALMREREDPGG
jgi:transcriptional regulator